MLINPIYILFLYYKEKSSHWYAAANLLPALNHFHKFEESDFLSKKISLVLDLSINKRARKYSTRHIIYLLF